MVTPYLLCLRSAFLSPPQTPGSSGRSPSSVFSSHASLVGAQTLWESLLPAESRGGSCLLTGGR